MKARSLVIAAGLVGAGIAAADRRDPPAADPTAIEPVKFSHAMHAALPQKVVRDESCTDCHGASEKGELALPGQKGHRPCLGCHVDLFLASGEATRRRDPKRWEHAIAFCAGCHRAPPQNYQKSQADAVYRLHPAPEYHVEFDHFEHTQKAACRDCHAVHPLLREPGHAECSSCHGVEAHSMTECASCHSHPAKSEVFARREERPFRVRHCNSPAHVREAGRRRKKLEEVPCFRHESDQHQFWSADPRRRERWEKGEPLQCGHCHFMLEDKKTWRALGHDYQTVKQIKAAPVMDNQRDRAHKRCGDQAACHRREVGPSTEHCAKCHDQQDVQKSLFH